jgi:hypothetical protein
MDRRTQTPETTAARDPSPECCPDPHAHPPTPPPGGAALIAGQAFVQTVHHFFPELNAWLDALPDSRAPEMTIYETRFMAWWGLWLYLGQLGSRRQLDFQLDAWGTRVLTNFNRLADTQHTTRPVNDTLDHYVGHVGPAGFAALRTKMARRLIRMKVLDSARLLGHLVLLADGTGLLCWRRRHCPHCLVQKHEHTTLYMHQVLEAKLLGPAGVVVSVGSEFIDNEDISVAPGKDADEIKQDCELKALTRLAPRLKKDYPQARFVLAGDSLYACGRTFQLAQDHDWAYVLTLKPGRLPTVWDEFQRLAPLCARQVLARVLADGTRQVYRWVHDLSYVDDQKRRWTFHALECVETAPDGTVTHYAWVTRLPVSMKTVEEIARKGGRHRWKIENEGFNRQKNSGLNLEHAYSTDPEKMQAYYYLLQIAFILTQLLERGSLLRQLTADLGKRLDQAFGSLANIAQRLLEGLRYCEWPEECFAAAAAERLRIRLEDSS